jgi:hypothetical protein
MYYAVETYGGMEVYLHVFLTSALEGRLVVSFILRYLLDRNLCGLTLWRRQKSLTYAGETNPDSSVVQLLA